MPKGISLWTMKRLLLILALLAPSAQAQSADEIAFMKSVLAQVQSMTLRAGREFCGYLALDENDNFKATPAKRGRKDSCRARNPSASLELIASYHSHGSYDEHADSEVPSTDDVLADADEEVDGWLVTPGGRIWFIDGQALTARQICGLGCVRADPNFEPGQFGIVKNFYTLDELSNRD